MIFVDDLGWDNMSCYHRGLMGSKTPNCDRIAKEGALFTDFYGQNSCTAGRSAFITGISPFRTGLLKVGLPGAKEGIQAGDPELPELLKPLGYVSAQYGKNHLGDRNEFLPTVHGFDEFFGFLYHLNAMDEPYETDYPKDPAFYAKYGPREVLDCKASRTTDRTEDPRWGVIGNQKITNGGPLAPSPETPVPSFLKKGNYFQTTYEETLLERSEDFMKRQVRRGNPFFLWHNMARMHIWTHLDDKWKGKSGYGLYADGMLEVDYIVGELLKTLDELKITDNTVVILTSDNGAEMMSWSDAGNTPFHSEKGTTWEGGFRVPMIVRWPGVIPAGKTINDFFSMEDWVPTLCDAAGNSKITEQLLKGKKFGDKTYKAHLDGYDLVPYFAALDNRRPGKQVPSPRHEMFYFSDNGVMCALRDDDYKINFKIYEGNLMTGVVIQQNAPTIINLRDDPYEKYPHEAWDYTHWFVEHVWSMYPAGPIIGKFMATFQEYPPSQAPGEWSAEPQPTGAETLGSRYYKRGMESMQEDLNTVSQGEVPSD